MTKADLELMVLEGEGSNLEFKHRLPDSERIAREVTALANTHGGHLLVGVRDDGTLSGVKDPEEEMYVLHEALNQHCTPEIALKSEWIKISRTRTVIAIEIPLSTHRPHYVRVFSSKQSSVFVRFQDMSIEASREARKLMTRIPASENTLIHLGEKERILFQNLEQLGQITVRKFSRIAKIPYGKASRIIVRMTRARLLVHHIDLNEDYFTVGDALKR